jgi:DNA-directed RNA polymerase specialized sigma24 family protein
VALVSAIPSAPQDSHFMHVRSIPLLAAPHPGLTGLATFVVIWDGLSKRIEGLTSSVRWSLTRKALERLLERLSPDREAAAQEYHFLRERLADYFDWKGVPRPESAADETLDRVARRLDEGEPVDRVLPYTYGVARLVLLERLRTQLREQRASASAAREWVMHPDETHEARIACLARCLETLPPDERAVILEYYEKMGGAHPDGRRLLAERLGIRYEALKTRTYRLRVRLEACLQDCLRARGGRAE